MPIFQFDTPDEKEARKNRLLQTANQQQLDLLSRQLRSAEKVNAQSNLSKINEMMLTSTLTKPLQNAQVDELKSRTRGNELLNTAAQAQIDEGKRITAEKKALSESASAITGSVVNQQEEGGYLTTNPPANPPASPQGMTAGEKEPGFFENTPLGIYLRSIVDVSPPGAAVKAGGIAGKKLKDILSELVSPIQ